MASPDLHGIFQIGVDLLQTTVNSVTSKILAFTGDVYREESDGDNVEWWQHVGFASRPSKPDTEKKQSAQAVLIKQGNQDVAIASQDVRSLGIYGNIKDGETCVYGAGADGRSQGRVLIKDNGSVTLYTTDTNTPEGNMVMLRISPQGGLEFTCQWGSMIFDQTGFHVKTQAGPRLDMGGVTLPGVPSSVTGAFVGYAKLTAPTVALEGINTVLGMGPLYLQASGINSALITSGAGGPIPLGVTDIATQAWMASNTVWLSV